MQQRAEDDRGIEGSGLFIPIQHQIWRDKYRYATDTCIADTWWRIANALAEAEHKPDRVAWAQKFYDAMEGFKFITAGRIISSAGTGRTVTGGNCFVMNTIPDSMDGIYSALRESALTMQQGGGIGMDFSSIRPKGAHVKGVDAEASGPLPFMDNWDSMCRTIMSAGDRRGAMMGTMRCDHPDVEAFIDAKRDRTRFRMFNLSVLVTDAFMDAVKNDDAWFLKFDGKPYKTVAARELWRKIMRNTYDMADPGVIFIDRVNDANNLNYCENISATNPCGEQPLPPYGACILGSINLAALVKDPFTPQAHIPASDLFDLTTTAVRCLDNVIDVTNFPLPQQRLEAESKRRIGLGITGLADALAMMGLNYATAEARHMASEWMQNITRFAYRTSIHLAEEKGCFPLYKHGQYGRSGSVAHKSNIPDSGIRNSHLISIAPTGTISLLAGNVSSGIEPIFDLEFERKILEADGSRRTEKVRDYAYDIWLKTPEYQDNFVTVKDLTPNDHLLMQAALQPWVDSSISKTINVPESIPFEDLEGVYVKAYELGLKGCTTYRPNDYTGSVLSTESKPEEPEQDEEVTVDMEIDLDRETLETLLEAHKRRNGKRHDVLQGKTYKLSWPNSPAFYVTINDGDDGKPYEIFVNCRAPDADHWVRALTRMISAVWRHGGDTGFVAEELKQIHDLRGGAFVDGKYVPSLIAAIGGVIETHCAKPSDASAPFELRVPTTVAPGEAARLKKCCPVCHSYDVVRQEGCDKCRACNYSKCG